jgi:hypothetical protein
MFGKLAFETNRDVEMANLTLKEAEAAKEAAVCAEIPKTETGVLYGCPVEVW